MQILLLEPDFWRFLGISQVLGADSSVVLVGDADHKKILGLRQASHSLTVDVVVISYSLVLDYQLAILQEIQKLFPSANILVEGQEPALETVADVLTAGAKGFFDLSSDPSTLVKALAVVNRGFIWAPREAVALMAKRLSERLQPSPIAAGSDLVTAEEMTILQLLKQGRRNKDIARNLGIAEVTAKAHLTRLYRKFGVHSRLELLAYALNHPLIADAYARTPLSRSDH